LAQAIQAEVGAEVPQRVLEAMAMVQAYVYDISGGMARTMSMAFVGKQVDLIPHTGIVAFGKEYFFGSGPCIGEPGKSIGIPVTQVLELGTTAKSMADLERHIHSVLAREHTPERYNFLSHNCNHFADDVAKFLLDGKGIPSHIVNIADEALNTPQGAVFRGMIEQMEAQARGQMGGTSSMNPFGDVGAAPPAAASTAPCPAPAAQAPPQSRTGLVDADAAIQELQRNPREVAKEALQTLLTIAENFIHKKDEKFRRIKQSNAAVQRKLTAVPGGVSCLLALGFRDAMHEGEAVWQGPQDRDGVDKLVDVKAKFAKEYDRFNEIPVSEARPQTANSGGILGMIENALQDPASLQRLLSNPMIAQMARANPQLVEGALQNPSVQTALQQNPEMRSQVEQLIGKSVSIPTAPSPPVQSVPSAAALQSELTELAEMGFEDKAACLSALQRSGGDLAKAIDLLTGES